MSATARSDALVLFDGTGDLARRKIYHFRFANSFLEPIFNRHYVAYVQLTMAERFGVEGRGAFYDSVGALRDVVQNHLLQVATLLAMDRPTGRTPTRCTTKR